MSDFNVTVHAKIDWSELDNKKEHSITLKPDLSKLFSELKDVPITFDPDVVGLRKEIESSLKKIKIDFDTSALDSGIAAAMQKATRKAAKQSGNSGVFGPLTGNMAEGAKSLQRLQSQYENIYENFKNFQSVDPTGELFTKSAENNMLDLKEKIKEGWKLLRVEPEQFNAEGFEKYLTKLRTSFMGVNDTYEEAQKNLQKFFTGSDQFSSGELEKKIAQVKKAYQDMGGDLNEPLKKEVGDIVANLDKVKGEFTKSLGDNDITNAVNKYKELTDSMQMIQNSAAKFKIEQGPWAGEQSYADQVKQQLGKINSEYDKMYEKFQKMSSSKEFGDLFGGDKIKDAFSTARKEIDDLSKDLINNPDAMTGAFDSAMSKLRSSMMDIQSVMKEAEGNVKTLFKSMNASDTNLLDKKIAQVKKAYQDMGAESNTAMSNQVKGTIDKLDELKASFDSAMRDGDVNQMVSSFNNLNDAIQKSSNLIQKFKSDQGGNWAGKSELDGLYRSLNQIKGENAQADNLRSMLNNAYATGGMTRNDFNSIRSDISNLRNGSNEVQGTWAKIGSTVRKATADFAAMYGAWTLFHKGTQIAKQMFGNVKNIDSAMIELKKVTNQTDDDYNAFMTRAASTSKELGSTMSGFITSTADFARLGNSWKDSQELARVASIYNTVGDDLSGMDMATEHIISTMNAFGIEANNAISIVDKLNEVSNRGPISSGGLGEALTRSASSMEAAGNTLDQTVGLITAANSVIQDPKTVGQAFKTISMRIRAADTELEAAGESTEGMARSTAALRAELKALAGVDIMQDESTFKSTYDILKDLSGAWKDLTDIQQASVTELVAGKHRGAVMSALMKNFDIAEQMRDVSENSEGSAMTEHEKAMKGLEARINQFKSSFESLSNTVMSADLMKGLIGGATGGLSALDNIIQTLGRIPSLISGIAAAVGVLKGERFMDTLFNSNGFLNLMNNFRSEGFTQALGNMFSNGFAAMKEKGVARTMAGGLKSAFSYAGTGFGGILTELLMPEEGKKEIRNFFEDVKKGGMSIRQALDNDDLKSFSYTGKGVVAQLAGEFNSADEAIAAYGTSMAMATAKTVAFKAIAGIGMGLMFAGISVAISAGIHLLDEWIHKAERAREAAHQLGEESLNKFNDTETNKDKYDKTYEEYRLGKATKDELSESAYELAASLGVESEALDNLITKYGSVNKAMQEVIDKNYEQQKQDNLTNLRNDLKAYSEEFYKAFGNAPNESDLTFGKAGALEQAIRDRVEAAGFSTSTYGAKAGKGLIEVHGLTRWDDKNNIDQMLDRYSELSNIRDKVEEGIGIDYTRSELESQRFYNDLIDSLNTIEKSEAWPKLKSEINAVNKEAAKVNFEKMFDSLDLDTKTASFQDVLDKMIELATTGNFGEEFFGGKAQLEDLFATQLANFDKWDLAQDRYKEWVREQSKTSADKLFDQFDFNPFKSENFSQRDADRMKSNIDRYVTDIQKLKNALADFELGNLKGDELDKLFEAFPKLEENVKNNGGNVHKAIREMMAGIAEEAKNDLNFSIGFTVDDDEKNAIGQIIDEIYDMASYVSDMEIKLDIKAETEGLDDLFTAINEANSASGLTSDSLAKLKTRFKNLQDYDPSKLFEHTANGMSLNNIELAKLESQYENWNKSLTDNQLDAMVTEYERLTKLMKKAMDEGNAEDAHLFGKDRDKLAEQISQVAELASQYEGLTSSYNKYLKAVSQNDVNANYNGMRDAFASVKELHDKGYVGTNAYKAGVQMMTNQDLSGLDVDQIDKIYQEGYATQQKYFTDSTAGAQKFVQDVMTYQKQLGEEWIKLDEAGNYHIDFGNNDKQVADLLSTINGVEISTEQLQAIMGQLRAMGWDIKITTNYTDFDQLKSSAEQAVKTLHDLGKLSDFEINVNTDNIDSIDEQIKTVKEAFTGEDGTFNVNLEGAEEAQIVLAALVARKQQLENPAILTISTQGLEDVDTNIANAIEQLQLFQSAVRDLQLSSALGDAGGIADATARIKEAAQGIKDIPQEVQTKLGLDDSDFQSKIDNILSASDENIKIGVDLDDGNIGQVQELINSKEFIAKVKLEIDDSDAKGETNNDITAKLKLDNSEALSAINDIKSQAANIPAKITPEIVGSGGGGGGRGTFTMANLIPDETIKIPVQAQLMGGVDVSSLGEPPTIPVTPKLEGSLDTSSIAGESPTLTVNAKLGNTSEISGYKPADKKATVNFNKNSSIPDGYQPANKNATVFYSRSGPDTSGITNITRTVTYNVRVNGSIPKAIGTAFPTGTLSDSLPSNWKLRKNGVALMGELGPELIVNGNSVRIAGENGAEFTPYKSGDIIFNASQTKELLRTGKIKGRGRLFGNGANYAEGTAFSNGSGKFKTPVITTTQTTTTQTTQTATTPKQTQTKTTTTTTATPAATDDSESIDWIEKLIDRFDRAFKKIEKITNSSYSDLSKRFESSMEQIDKLTEKYEILQQAQDRYIQEADSVGVSDEIKSLVQNGTIDIAKYDKETKKLIDSYSQWYEKALNLKDQMDDLAESLAKVYKLRFDMSKEQYSGNMDLYGHVTETYDTGLDYLEKRGLFASQSYYEAKRKTLEIQRTSMEHSLSDLIAAMSEGVNSGKIKEWSDDWYAMQKEINGVKEEMQKLDNTILDIDNSMRKLSWDKFDYLLDLINEINKEANFFVELLSYKPLHDKNTGEITDAGMATMGMYAQQYNQYMHMADKYGEELKKITADLKKNPYDQELIKRQNDLRKSQQDSILTALKMRKSIGDLIKEGYEAEKDALDKLIEKYGKALDAQKDLYDYQRKLNSQTKDIANIQKQLAAYANDDSEETRAKVQKLKVQLEEKEQNLTDTEYERNIAEQKKMLDNLSLEFQTKIDERMDNIDSLIDQQINDINLNADRINDTLHQEADAVGYTMSDNMQQIWETSVNPVVSTYYNGFQNSLTTISATLANLYNFVQWSANKSETIANKTISTTTSTTSPNAPTKKPEPAKTETKKETPKQDTFAVGSKINAAGAPIYASSTGQVGQWGTNQAFSADPVYVITGVSGDYVLVRHHTQSANAGWFKKSDIKAYKTGGLIDYTGPAWVDGTKGNPEAILNSKDTKMLFALTDALRRANLSGTSIMPARSSNMVGNTATGDFNFNIAIDHVEDYNELVQHMRDDIEFERLVQDMTVNQLMGKGSSLSKYSRFK